MAYSPDEIQLDGITFDLFLSEKEIMARVEQVAAEMAASYREESLVLVSILKGAFIFTADFYRNLPLDVPISFIRAQSYEGMRSTGKVEFSGLDDISVEGKQVLVLEDIVDTGNTLSALAPQLKDMGAAGIRICTLLFKPDVLKHELPPITACFEIPPDFVVGYGLDYNQLGRNLAGIYRKRDEG